MEAASMELQKFWMTEGDSVTHWVARARHSCYKYGNPKHGADTCPHKNKQFNKCGKTGHLARACKSKGESAPQSHKPSQAKGTHLLQASSDDEGSRDNDDFLEPDPGLHIVGQGSRYKKLTTSIRLNGVSVKFEVDTGAELSSVPLSLYNAKLPNSKCILLLPRSVNTMERYFPQGGRLWLLCLMANKWLMGRLSL